VLEHVNDPLATVPAVALCGGVAVYLLSHNGMRYRSVRTVNRGRLLAAAASAALIPVATRVDGVVSLALVAGVCIGLIAYETLRFREARARLRAAA
jgi:Bacterial low temperature requirement A protein (LtrA)